MTTAAALVARIRSEVGDYGAPFRDDFAGSGELGTFDLSETNVSATGLAVLLEQDGTTQALAAGTDYRLDPREGRLVLLGSRGPLRFGQHLIVQGSGGGMFSDEELGVYVADAFAQHTYGRTIQTRYRDTEHGFLHYTDDPYTLASLPPVEEPLVAYLAIVNVLWTLATDASTDIDISTAEGTFVARTQRYRQLMDHIAQVQDRYNTLSSRLNVGLGSIEQFTLRRVSRSTNRLVPVFRPREYDDTALPTRLLPPIDEPDQDTSGIPSPIMPGVWG